MANPKTSAFCPRMLRQPKPSGAPSDSTSSSRSPGARVHGAASPNAVAAANPRTSSAGGSGTCPLGTLPDQEASHARHYAPCDAPPLPDRRAALLPRPLPALPRRFDPDAVEAVEPHLHRSKVQQNGRHIEQAVAELQLTGRPPMRLGFGLPPASIAWLIAALRERFPAQSDGAPRCLRPHVPPGTLIDSVELRFR